MKPFQKNDWVRLKSNKKEARIADIHRDGSLILEIEKVRIACRPEDIEPSPVSQSEKSKLRRQSEKLKRSSKESLHGKKHQIDLHGLRVEEALSQLERAVNHVLIEDIDHLIIIHGLGSGRVMMAVHHYLKNLSHVKRFAVDEKNAGQTHVYF